MLTKSMAAKLSAAVITAAMSTSLVSLFPCFNEQGTSADFVKTKNNSSLDVSEILAPTLRVSSDPWNGSYLYYGHYDKKPIRFRVLAPSTDKFYDNATIFLDSDEVLFKSSFDTDSSNIWKDTASYKYSDLYMNLNFQFIYSAFNAPEVDAIVPSTIEGADGLDGDKLFILDSSEIADPQYGYGYDLASDKNGESYWLRSKGASGNEVASVSNGSLTASDAGSELGVAPAMNIDVNSVLFTSRITGDRDQAGAEYKLTILDKNLEVKVPSDKEITSNGNTVTVPYEIKGRGDSQANQVSILILAEEYDPLNTPYNEILYYDPLNNTHNNGSFDPAGAGTFTLPSKFDINSWGEDYHVYILAEDINGVHETDFASRLVEITKSMIK